MKIGDRVHSLTTIVDVEAQGLAAQGTGFFYHVLGSHPEGAGPGWQPVESNWLITNRHVLLPRQTASDDERIPEKLVFRLRTLPSEGGVTWLNVELAGSRLLEAARLHQEPTVDVVAIEITNDIRALLKDSVPITYSAVGESDFPGVNKIDATVATDVVVVGYPKGYYDSVNKFPVVKSGMVASRWGAHFENSPAFLIDAKLFPGSSGSIVITKPASFVVENGQFFSSQEMQFCFLGIFSGEPYKLSAVPVETDEGVLYRKEYFNLGLVWYYSLVPEILAEGQTLAEFVSRRRAVPLSAAPVL